MSNPKDLGLQGVAEKMDDETERLIGACYTLDGDENSWVFNALRARNKAKVAPQPSEQQIEKAEPYS